MTLDRRLPAVYVDVEDRSLATEEIQTGRSGYVVILSDRGPHNKIVEVNSRQSFYDLFGRPDFTKYGQGHYLADQHLKTSNRLFVCRPTLMEPFGDADFDDCMAISNNSIGFTASGRNNETVKGTFIFTQGSNIVSYEDGDLNDYSNNVKDWIGKWICPIEVHQRFAQQILSIDLVENEIILRNTYVGPDTDFINVEDEAQVLNVTFTFTNGSSFVEYKDGDLDALGNGEIENWIGRHIYNIDSSHEQALRIINIDPDSNLIELEDTWEGPTTQFPDPSDFAELVTGEFTFTNNSTIVTYEDDLDLNSYTGDWVGKWIFPDAQAEHAVKVISVDTDEKEIHVESLYIGPTSANPESLYLYEEIILPAEGLIKYFYIDPDNQEADINIFVKTFVESSKNIRDFESFDPLDQDICWYFHAIGAGEPYNSYFLKGARNTEFERIYTDSDGEPLFPYMFMDVAVYRRNEDNTDTLMEGPWTVSLINRTHTGSIVRDIYTGIEIYLPTVINKNSKILRAVESRGTVNLLTIEQGLEYPFEPDVQTRLSILSAFENSIFLENGSNGNLFDETGNLNYSSNEYYKSLVAQAYNGSLKSTDGSMELILQSIYPWYVFDYVYCGAYGSMAANAARELVDVRQDCLLLSDTGGYVKTPEEDLDLRLSHFGWNTYNAALYVQFRKIEDKFTGKEFYITPVYHALDRHLHVDANYWIAEPVANIEKGAISEAVELAYRPNLTKLGDLIEKEMNPVIVEPDGVYLITQLTTWKRLSVLKRQHVVKFIHFCRKRIPSLLKDLLQRKGSIYWINQAQERINGFMNPFVDTGELDRYAAITSYKSIVKFDEVRSELIVSLTISPIRAIEKITVNIIVV